MGKLGRFQTLEFNSWSGITKETHLGTWAKANPQMATNLMIEMLAAHHGPALESFLSKLPIKWFDSDEDYFWHIIGSSRRNIPLIEARHLDGTVVEATDMVGVGGATPFYVVFGEDWFGDGEVIVGEKNELYPIRILGPGRMEGTNAVYKVELMGGITGGMPGEELILGKRFSADYAPVSRSRSRGVGTVRYTSPVMMRNEFSQFRIKSEIGGNMLGKKVAIGIPFINNKGQKTVHTMWTFHEEYKIEEQFREYKNNILMWGRSNRTDNGEYLNFDKSGEVIRMGAGLDEQLGWGGTIYYNTFSLKLLEDALFEVTEGKVAMNNRRVLLRTGERGAVLFHKAILNNVSGWQAIGYLNGQNASVINKTASPLHSNSLSAGFQFTEYKAPNGIILTLEVDSFYSDPVRNKIMHPDGGVAMSRRFDLVIPGSTDAPNIQIAKIKGFEETRGFQSGMRNPYTGAMTNDNMSFDEDKAVFHRMAALGVFVLDPTRTISLIPSILA